MKTEKAVRAAILRYIKKMGKDCYYVGTEGGPYGRKGVPDLLICYKGQFIACELKRPGGKPTPLQVRELELAEKAGAHSVIATGVDDLKTVIEKIDIENMIGLLRPILKSGSVYTSECKKCKNISTFSVVTVDLLDERKVSVKEYRSITTKCEQCEINKDVIIGALEKIYKCSITAYV